MKIFGYVLWLLIWIIKKFYYKNKAKNIKFLLVKIPKRDSELDKSQDNIQSMKQNIEVMNQVLKNVYSIYKSDFLSRVLGQDYISLEILVERELIKFILGVPAEYVETFEKMISNFYPGSVIDVIERPKLLEAWKYMRWWYFVLEKDDALPIKTYENFEADPMDSILSSFSRVQEDEKLNLQILISPLSEKWQHKLRKKIEKIKKWRWFFSQLFGFSSKKEEKEAQWKFTSSQIQDLEKKVNDEGFEIVIRAFATWIDPVRPKRLIEDLVRSFNQYNYIWLNKFVFFPAKNLTSFAKDTALRLFSRPFFTLYKRLFFINSQILNIKEVSSIYHFPHSRFNKNPRILWQKFKIVPAPDDLPKEWILLWHNLYAWVKRPIYLSPMDRFRHFYIIWQTGTGKSTMLLVQAKQDLLQWRGFCLIDPHGDLCEFLLQYYPKERIEDLIYFDAWDTEYPIWFNVLEAETEEERDIVTNDLVEMFIQMYWPEIFWPRIQDYFRNGVLTLMEQPEWWTLVEIVRLFTDEAFQRLKLKNVKNPVVRAWWEKTFAAMGDREKQEMIPYFQSKFWPFTTTPIIRNIIWQPKSSFDIYQAMQEGKVILLNLSKGRMGELNSKLLWSMMVTHIKLAALRRAQIPEAQRVPFFLYIDEFQNYINPSIETILSEARKYRLGLIIAHQYIDQLVQESLGWKTDLRPAIFGNVGSMMAYRVWPEDAEFLEKQFAPDFSKTDLINMDRFKWVIKLSVNTSPTRPFSISVLNPYEKPLNPPEKVKIIKEISRLKWGRKKDLVEKEIYYRVGA